MNAKELIEKLKEFPPEMDVLVNGYETGFDHIKEIKLESVVKRLKPDWFDGEFDGPRDAQDESKKAVVIWRPCKND